MAPGGTELIPIPIPTPVLAFIRTLSIVSVEPEGLLLCRLNSTKWQLLVNKFSVNFRDKKVA
jgi:hypothetical protein